MASYQDIDTRLKVLEDKVDFTMKAFSVQRKSKTLPTRITVINLLDVYREMKANDEEAVYASDVAEVVQKVGDEVV